MAGPPRPLCLHTFAELAAPVPSPSSYRRCSQSLLSSPLQEYLDHGMEVMCFPSLSAKLPKAWEGGSSSVLPFKYFPSMKLLQ